MDKTGFLKELKQYLAVLNEEEQKDILDEYAQHIDMKMGTGMSESEAIKDFGGIEELACEILEAYHVNPQFSAKRRGKMINKEELPLPDLAKTGRKLGDGSVRIFTRLWTGMKAFVGKVREGFRSWSGAVREKWLVWKGTLKRQQTDRKNTEQLRKGSEARVMPGGLLSGTKRFIIAVISVVLWCIRWMWNIVMICLALSCGATVLILLFGAGLLAVLMIQGYPLVGLMIGFVGAVLCSGSMTVLLLGMVRRRPGKEPQTETKLIQEVEEHA